MTLKRVGESRCSVKFYLKYLSDVSAERYISQETKENVFTIADSETLRATELSKCPERAKTDQLPFVRYTIHTWNYLECSVKCEGWL